MAELISNHQRSLLVSKYSPVYSTVFQMVAVLPECPGLCIGKDPCFPAFWLFLIRDFQRGMHFNVGHFHDTHILDFCSPNVLCNPTIPLCFKCNKTKLSQDENISSQAFIVSLW